MPALLRPSEQQKMIEIPIWEDETFLIFDMSKFQPQQLALPLPVLPEGWAAEKDFKAIGTLSPPTQRNIEPVGPHFLAHARRVSALSSEVIGDLYCDWKLISP